MTDAAGVEPFTDAHVHFWDHARAGLRWRFLEPGFHHPRLKGTQSLDAPRYTPAELRAEAGVAAPTKVVHIQCAAPTDDPTREAAWLEELADEHGWPDALVAGCALRSPQAAATIAAHARCRRWRGVRDLSVQEPLEPGHVADAFAAAAAHGASVELMLPLEHYRSLAALARRWPDVVVVLGHAGQPLERGEEYRARWSRALTDLAGESENVVLKVSAIASSADPRWSVESITPWVLAAVEAFGPDRTMLGTNWPIDRLFGTYADLVSAYRAIVARLDAPDRAAVLHGTADRIYGI